LYHLRGADYLVTKIRKWGNTQGLRLARQILQEAHISVGDDVDVFARNGLIILAPMRRIRGKQSLKELVSRIPKNYTTEEVDWGGSRSAERRGEGKPPLVVSKPLFNS
jgi:antitoxin MazE